MKKLTQLSILFMIILVTGSCFPGKKLPTPENVITHLSDTVIVRDGSLVYALPRTIFTIKVKLERIIELPGPYAKYAEELLGLNNIIMKRGEHWMIKSLLISTHEETDPSEFYIIESNNLFQTNILALKREGLILDLNPETNSASEDFLNSKEMNINQFRSYDLGSDEYYMSQADTGYKRVKVDSTFIRIPYIVEKKKKLAIDQLAERAARRLMELREGKILILTGEANVFPQNDAAINELNRLEKEYTELFVGKSLVETRNYLYQFIPQKELAGKAVTLFRFSEITGIEDVSANTGTPVIMELVPEMKIKDLTIISGDQSTPASLKFDKIFYRIPDVVNVKISSGKEILYTSRKLIYQLGEIIQLPSNYVIGK